MAVFGPFFGPWVAIPCQRWRPCFDIFPMFSVFFGFLTTWWPCFSACFIFHIYSFLYIFTTNIAQHSTQHTQYTTTHAHTTCTPATDRDLESGLCKSNARKNRQKCLKKAKSGESLAKARFDIDGQIILLLGRSGERRIEPSGSWFPPKFPSFSGKSDWFVEPRTPCSRTFLKLQMGTIQCLLPLNPSSKWQLHVDHSWWT